MSLRTEVSGQMVPCRIEEGRPTLRALRVLRGKKGGGEQRFERGERYVLAGSVCDRFLVADAALHPSQDGGVYLNAGKLSVRQPANHRKERYGKPESGDGDQESIGKTLELQGCSSNCFGAIRLDLLVSCP